MFWAETPDGTHLVAPRCPQNKVHAQSTPYVVVLQPSLPLPDFPSSQAPCAAATLASLQHPGCTAFSLWALNVFSSLESSPFCLPSLLPK